MISSIQKIIDSLSSLNPNISKLLLLVGSGIIVLSFGAKGFISFKKTQRRRKWASVGKNVVVLHQFERGKNTPSISNFPLKLETYLRLAGIPYENDFEEPMGPKGKSPWITLNGEEVADSQMCLELLAKNFNKNFSSHLSQEERAIARAFQIMAEEHLYWVILLHRWVYSRGTTLGLIQSNLPFLSRLLMPLITRKLKDSAIGQGMGRHTEAEVIEMGFKDLGAISTLLGSKPYFMGDKTTEVDCAMFGLLAQYVWNMPGSPFEHHFNEEFLNLKNFCLRMKEIYWPDWDRCLLPPRV